MESVRKVRVLYNDGRSGLIQIEDDFGDCWVRRGRVHLVDGEYFLTSERQADIMRKASNARKKREAKRQGDLKLAREPAVAPTSARTEFATLLERTRG